jgi:hypothetical protein
MPAVTPDEADEVGTWVATPAVPVIATGVQQWMWDAVIAVSPPKLTSSVIVSAVVSTRSVAAPKPADALGGASAAPLRIVE